MWRGWLLLPILLPVLGGIGVLGIHTLRVRRRTVSLLLAVQLLVVAAVFRMEGGALCVPHPDGGGAVRAAAGRAGPPVCRADLRGVVRSGLFAFEYMNHEGHRERFFGFYLLTLGALMGCVWRATW